MAAGRSSTGISPRPMLMGAPRNALRAFNAGVSLSCLCILAHRLPHLFCGLVLSLTCLVGVPSCGLATDFMAHRPTGSTQADRIRLPYTARRLSLSRWDQSPASAKEERVSRLPSARAERIKRASRPGSVGFLDSVSCGHPRTHEAFRPCHRGYGYTGGSYSRHSMLKAVAGGPDLDTMNRNAMKRNGGAEHE